MSRGERSDTPAGNESDSPLEGGSKVVHGKKPAFIPSRKFFNQEPEPRTKNPLPPAHGRARSTRSIVAVSTRRMMGPRLMGRQPWSRAVWYSSWVKSPSGPMQSREDEITFPCPRCSARMAARARSRPGWRR